jgi:methoxymalonate biosynthesis protein
MAEPDRRGRVKCVVWDLDNTLLSGTWLEAAQAGAVPAADPELLAALAELHGRGVLASVASRNPAAAAARVREAVAWPVEFVAPQYGWGRKSESLRRVAAELNIGSDALAFVDDDPYERAEVAFALPEVLVLSPEEVTDALGWPELSPPVVTAEARRRAGSYAQARQRQQAAREFGRSRDEFLRWCRTTVTISPATPADLPRLHELAARTHQFNSARRSVPESTVAGWLGSARHEVVVLRLRDRFGDDGLVGAAIVDSGGAGDGGPEWTVELLMMSCRAMGRGAIDTLLAWLTRAAGGAGARMLRVPCRLDGRNVPLRLALVAAGFRAEPTEPDGDGRTHFARALSGPLPELPDWTTERAEQ